MASKSQPFDNVFFSVVSNAPDFVNQLFNRKFGSNTPDHGYSVISFYRKDWRHFVPICYVNFLPYDEVLLAGGAMTDGFAFRLMPKSLFDEIKRAEGIYFHLLKFAFNHFRNDCEAFFGYAGDKLSYQQAIKAGFEPAGFKHLLAHFQKPLTQSRQRYLIEKIYKYGPF